MCYKISLRITREYQVSIVRRSQHKQNSTHDINASDSVANRGRHEAIILMGGRRGGRKEMNEWDRQSNVWD